MRILIIENNWNYTEYEWDCYSFEHLGHLIEQQYELEEVREIIILEY